MLANPIGAGCHGLVDMNAGRGLPRTGTANVRRAIDPLANGVIKDEDTIRLERRLNEGFRGRIVDAPHLLLVIKIPDRRGVADEREAFAIERESACNRTPVENRYLMRFRQRRRFPLAGRRIEGVGPWLAGRRRKIVELGDYKGKRFDLALV
jgi:hypothetical protein